MTSALPARRVLLVVLAAVVAVVLVVGVATLWPTAPEAAGKPRAGGPSPDVTASVPATTPPATPTPAVTPSATPKPKAKAKAKAQARCATATGAFTPRRITVPGVIHRAGVVMPARTPAGVPGVPPLTSAGKSLFAFDSQQGIRPGDPAGNVLLNAHTWPDGSALGNRLLAGLQRGERIIVHGAGGPLCYRVTERVQVPGDEPMPRYYVTDGPPQLAIVVCSGRRLGPGVWEKRTVWFASPTV